ncbi:hypothetical protein PRIPAC_74742 [Pristionchus pacificus]|uniref:Uncharacterized protein n=1 Tax=Pristionchus pacificus TaxID=54126 RepID=A0A2A6B511_PRIPA|nr:hypothetical protein PRIPAC_74742 [Pristionchus pacificus]|eukprot:PDM60966.1 hypothetical protein PRIPAC_54772 [Pristionchus pacificus]
MVVSYCLDKLNDWTGNYQPSFPPLSFCLESRTSSSAMFNNKKDEEDVKWISAHDAPTWRQIDVYTHSLIVLREDICDRMELRRSSKRSVAKK